MLKLRRSPCAPVCRLCCHSRLLSTAAVTPDKLTATAPATGAPQSLWSHAKNVDASRCTDTLVREADLRVMEEIITKEEETIVADECMKILKRRRYEEDHWDQVIVKFKEMERSRWSTETKRILDRVREAPILPQGLTYFPAVHVIDLAEDGYIKPHVDSIKVRAIIHVDQELIHSNRPIDTVCSQFSGQVVAGVSLLSPSIMRFKEEHGESLIDAFLPRRSLYTMTGRVRYHYTHEILPGVQLFRNEFPVNRTRRISIMLRDEFQEKHAVMLRSLEQPNP